MVKKKKAEKREENGKDQKLKFQTQLQFAHM